uniref:Uncharacterized protein n=1 Tax=Anguilla anguilla TaxID=7936 RepID=A0A0E9TFV7_ANGAN
MAEDCTACATHLSFMTHRLIKVRGANGNFHEFNNVNN